MLVKVLVENTEGHGLCAEHGLCLHVEYRNKKYLIDTGASRLFAENADKMGIDLTAIDMAFLSHAHYDHSGGYPEFFRRNSQAQVCLQRAAGTAEYYKITETVRKNIGIPGGILDTYAHRFRYIDGAAEIDEGVHILPHSAQGISERAALAHMYAITEDETRLDDFSHEQTVIFEEADGLVCFNSCSHAGVERIIEEVKQAFPSQPIKAYIGGFHMMGTAGPASCSCSKEEVQRTAASLLTACGTKFYSGHCTGSIAYGWLKEVLQDRLEALYTGKTIEL